MHAIVMCIRGVHNEPIFTTIVKEPPLIPYIGYFELICYNNTATQTVTTTTKPTNWRIEWTFMNDGNVACLASASGSDFPAKVPTPKCYPYEATVTTSAPIH